MRIGSIVQYRDFMDGIRTVKVTEKHEDIKNGKPGFVGVCLDNEGLPVRDERTGEPFMVWGYSNQVFAEIY